MSGAHHLILLGTHHHFIHAATFDPSTKSLTQTASTEVAEHPSWLVQHPKYDDVVYSTGHVDGKVFCLRLLDEQGNLAVLDEASSGGAGPCHLAVLPDHSGLVISHYKSGTVTVIPLSPAGRFRSTVPAPAHRCNLVYQQQAHPRQEGPHAHQAVVYDEQILVPDLGSNRVQRLKWDQKWTDEGAVEGFDEGDGPRHCVLHPKGRHLYTLNELSQTLTVHSLSPSGPAEAIARFTTLSPDDQPYASAMSGAEIVLLPSLHPGGPLLLMASNRDSPSSEGDTVALFSVDPEDGGEVKKTGQGWARGLGKHLRGMEGSADGRYVVVAGRNGGGISVLERVGEDGLEVKKVAGLEGLERVVAPIWVRR